MLLPSAIGCDSSSNNAPRARFASALFASPPISPPTSSASSPHPAINNLYSTCRVLQSMLTGVHQLPSPPAQHIEVPSLSPAPSKLRLRSRKPNALEEAPTLTKKKIAKRARDPTPRRGVNKRRRDVDDDMGRHDMLDSSSEEDEVAEEEEHEMIPPSTPKRARLAPENLPLGLARSDYHTLHLQNIEHGMGEMVEESIEGEGRNDEWSTEEDRILVELVLEKLKLTKSEWQDCARSLGKDRNSVGRRWKSLMGGGEVGLKRMRRGRIHATWR